MNQAQSYQLTVSPRELLGRKSRRLKAQGLVPANIYGKGLESVAIQVDLKNFVKVYDEAGETALVHLQLDGKGDRPALINQVFYHPITGEISHIDFRQVDLKVKITTHVPIELVGEAPSVKEKNAVIVQLLEELEVEVLPSDIPESINVDISTLVDLGDTITVAQLQIPSGVEVITDAETAVVLAQEVKEEVEEAPTEAETPAETPTAPEAEPAKQD